MLAYCTFLRLNIQYLTVMALLVMTLLMVTTACTPKQYYNYATYLDLEETQTTSNLQVAQINNTRAKLMVLQSQINHLESQILPPDYIDQAVWYLSNTSDAPTAALPLSVTKAHEELQHLTLQSKRTNYNTTIITEQRDLMTQIEALKAQQISLYEHYVELLEHYLSTQ